MRVYLKEIKYELLKSLRMPAYSLPTILFPLFFYLFFGIGFGAARNVGNVTMAAYLIATYSAMGVIGASLFGFGVGVAIERGQGWLEAKRTTPMPIAAYFVAKIAVSMVFSAIIIIMLMVMGTTMGNVTLTWKQAVSLFAILQGGSITFCAMGLAMGMFAGPNSAAPIVNLIYLPMSFLSGLWIPIWILPKLIQDIALVLPPYHFSQLALKVMNASKGGTILVHIGAMILATILFTAIAYAGYRRDEGKTYG
jgi:ABC-2 type transport system permease protein